MNIPELHLREVCKIGQGNECCRYITVGAGGIKCAKCTPFKNILDAKVINMTAKGDNCDGLKATINPDAERKLVDAFGFGRLGV